MTTAVAAAAGTHQVAGNVFAARNARGEVIQADAYAYRPPTNAAHRDVVTLIKSIRCFVYQACEVRDWDGSTCDNFCKKLERQLVYHLPGFDKAPWGLS